MDCIVSTDFNHRKDLLIMTIKQLGGRLVQERNHASKFFQDIMTNVFKSILSSYRNRATAIIAELREGQRATLTQNKEYTAWYFGSTDEGLTEISKILDSIYVNNLSYHAETNVYDNNKLHFLRSEQMNDEIAVIKKKLAATKYQLDDMNTVFAVCGTSQMELVSSQSITAPPGLIICISLSYA